MRRKSRGMASGKGREAIPSESPSRAWSRSSVIVGGVVLLVAGLALAMAIRPGGRSNEVLPIDFPDLSGLSEADREQIENVQRRLLEHAPEDPEGMGEAYGELGRHYLAYEFYDVSVLALSNAAALDDSDYRWPYFLGYVARNEARYEDAIQHFEDALRLMPEDQTTLARLAETQRTIGNESAAKETLDRLLELAPDHPTANYLLGLIAVEQEAYAEAVRHLEAAMEAQPSAGSLRYPLSQAYRGVGDLEASNFALQGDRTGRIVLSDPLVKEVSSLRRSAASRISEASREASGGRVDEALRLYREAAELEPENVLARRNLASMLSQIGEKDEARDELDSAIELEPMNPSVNLDLGMLLLESDEVEESLPHLQIAIDSEPKNRKARLAISEALFKLRRCEAAVPALRARLVDEETDHVSRLRLAVCLVMLEQQADALEVVETGLALDSEQVLLTAAAVRLLSASPEEALRDGQRALSLAEALVESRETVDALEVKAMALAELGRFDEAVEVSNSVLAQLETSGQEARYAWNQEVRELYASGRPVRTPWPPYVIRR